MRASEWRSHESTELDFQLKELRKRQFELRFRGTSEEISDTKELHRVRRDIARVLTIMGEKKRMQDAGTAGGDA